LLDELETRTVASHVETWCLTGYWLRPMIRIQLGASSSAE
jgi:hypothetical protein